MKKYLTIKIAISLLIGLMITSSCGNDDPSDPENPGDDKSLIMYHSVNDVYVSELVNLPPGAASNEKTVYSIPNDWRFTALSVSPSGKWGTIGLFSNADSDSKKYIGKIRIYDLSTNTFNKEYGKSDFIRMLGYPVPEASMFVEKMYWMDNDRLLIHMQPQTYWVGSLPQNVSLVVDIITDKVIEKKESGRQSPYAITAPDHPSKTKYNAELRNQELYIGGGKVSGLRTLSAFDLAFRD